MANRQRIVVQKPPKRPVSGGWKQVISVPGGGEGLTGYACTVTLSGLWCHYIHDAFPAPHLVPHTVGKDEKGCQCQWCDQRYRKLFKSYLPFLPLENSGPRVLELPLMASQQLQQILQEEGPIGSLLLHFRRHNVCRKDSKIVIERRREENEILLPEPFCPIPHVLHMWGCDSLLESCKIERSTE